MNHQQMMTTFLVLAWAALAPVQALHEAQAPQQQPEGKAKEAFPLTVRIAGSKVFRSPSEDSSSAPGLVYVGLYAAINGDSHWDISCQQEEGPLPTLPCTPLEPGNYPARWMHNGELLQLVVEGADGHLHLRFFDVEPRRSAPPSPQDKALAFPPSQLNWTVPMPKGRRLADYPLLLHIYATRSYGYTKFTLPGRTSCAATGSENVAYVTCTDYPPLNVRGAVIGFFATLDGEQAEISCSQGLWGNCTVLPPGIYLARWKNSKRQQVQLVVPHKKPWEMTLAVKVRPAQMDSSVGRPPE